MSPAIIPFCYFFASLFFALVGLQSQPWNRAALFIVNAFFGILSFRRITDVTSSFAHGSMIGMFYTVWLAHMSYILCMEGSQHHPAFSKWNWHAAYKMVWNVRWIGTAHEAPSNIGRPFSAPASTESGEFKEKSAPASQSKDHSAKRRIFLLKGLMTVAAIYGLNMLYEHALKTVYPLQFLDFEPAKQSYLRRLGDVSTRETTVRAILAFNFVFSSWALLTGWHTILSVFFVGVGLDEPEEWPSLWGSPAEMTSVRKFWGKFWHRSAFRAYIGYGNLVAGKFFGLKRGTMGYRMCAEFTVFFVSGCMHALTTRTLGFKAGYWEDIAWFCMNFAAILLETAFQIALKGLVGRPNDRLSKVVGAVWLFAFFFWSMPKSQSPKVYNGMVSV